ncbi:ester cyclase [Jhaorihella thermophila]|uniref:Predicted ester cyclase n=1 Tax=Jhaorihella thermophila TaxID=488547 RepID=A0A1H5YFV4_9RHOB|nr:ester cyclase [Jhaorihella thermophila]SEG22928.1 Predicted ester cyclase [Jhaorihella thermophila]
MSIGKSPREVVEAFVEAVNAQDWRALETRVASGFVRHAADSGPPVLSDRSELVDFLRQEFRVFPDAVETIEDLLCEGDKVAVRHRFSGTQNGPLGEFPASGKRATADYIAIYRIEGGMIAESWVAWDNLSVLRQLGHG